MSHDEEQHRKSRVVIETPTERREVVQQQTYRTPERERSGFSGGMVAAVALAAIAATAIVFLFVMNRGDDDSNTNISVNARGAATQPTPLVQQPPVLVQSTPLPAGTPIIIQQAPATAPPVIIQQPAPAAPSTATAPPPSSSGSATDDASVQAKLDEVIREDASLTQAGVTATIISGKVTINGAVNSQALKDRVEKLVYAVKGVQSVDNRITVVPRTP
jgi:hypothetical protein